MKTELEIMIKLDRAKRRLKAAKLDDDIIAEENIEQQIKILKWILK